MTTTKQYSSMAKFMGMNLISGKLKWSKCTTNKNYAPHLDEALSYINEKGYYVDDEGNCVKIPDEEAEG